MRWSKSSLGARRPLRGFAWATPALAAALLFAPAPTRAGTVSSNQTLNNTGVAYTAVFELFNVTPNSARLEIDVTNTTSGGVGGALTAFAFNNPGNRIDNVTFVSSTEPGFDSLLGGPQPFNKNNINTPGQFGNFDIGVGTANNFNGGNVGEGLSPGETDTFVLNLTGTFTGLNALSLQALIISAFSQDGANFTPSVFAARFQGLSVGEGSDVAVTAIPEPSTTAMVLGFLVPLGLYARRRASQRSS